MADSPPVSVGPQNRSAEGYTRLYAGRSPNAPGFGPLTGEAVLSARHIAGQWLLPALLGALAGRAMLPGEAVPLAAGYVVALLALGDVRRALAATAGVLAAMAWTAGSFRLAEQVLIFALAWFLAGLFGRWSPEPILAAQGGAPGHARSGKTPLPGTTWAVAVRLALMVCAGTLLLRLGMLYVLGAAPDKMAWAGVESVLELAAALVLLPAASLHRARPAALDGPYLAGLLVAFGGVAWNTASLTAGSLTVGQVLILYGILLFALGGGSALSTPAGTLLGLLAAAAGAPPQTVGMTALAGLGAGLGQRGGKFGVIGGMLVGQVAMSLLAFSGADIRAWAAHGAAAALLIVLTPARVLEWWSRQVSGPSAGRERKDSARFDERRVASAQLRRLSHVFDELASAFSPSPGAGQEREEAQEGQGTMRLLVEGVTERICSGCSAYSFCWEDHFQESYRDLKELAATAGQKGRLSLSDLPEGLNRRCIQPRKLLRACAETMQLINVHRTWEQRFAESRELVPQQLRGIARLVRDMAAQVEERGIDWGPLGVSKDAKDGAASAHSQSGPPWPLQVETAIARRAKGGSSISGDSDATIDLGSGRLALVLSDGMGVGERAAAESQAVVRVLRRLMEAGFDRRFAVKIVNSVLLLRSPEETFATIDMAILDLRSQVAEFLKVGAPPTFVKRADRVQVIRGNSLPAGILQQLDVDVQRVRLRPGDVLVMVTDGFLDSFPPDVDSEKQLADKLGASNKADPAELARELLEGLGEENALDDVTLLVAKVRPYQPSLPSPDEVGVYRRA